ncbi:ENV1 protein, partial [Nyctiprogne leucopyga]|nr:ENV1 protein [Nyctiprogne leucopyga]
TPGNPLWKVMQAAYQTLNESNPDATTSCWLCYDVKPPFYEGIALATPYHMSSKDNPSQCNWNDSKAGITLQHVRGQGLCIG